MAGAAAFLAGIFVIATASSAMTIASDAVPPSVLGPCDAAARAQGAYAAEIEAARRSLVALSVFDDAEFEGVRIGYCGLVAAEGPVATTSCADDIILLDEKYAAPAQSLVLAATLAHEMKHVLQHREKRAASDAGYCADDAYLADRAALEADAEAFGGAVLQLVFAGREIAIRNACPAPVSVFVAPDAPKTAAGATGAAFAIAPGAAADETLRSASRSVRYAAISATANGRRHRWAGEKNAERRMVGGERIPLIAAILPVADRADGPFQLTLRCDDDSAVRTD